MWWSVQAGFEWSERLSGSLLMLQRGCLLVSLKKSIPPNSAWTREEARCPDPNPPDFYPDPHWAAQKHQRFKYAWRINQVPWVIQAKMCGCWALCRGMHPTECCSTSWYVGQQLNAASSCLVLTLGTKRKPVPDKPEGSGWFITWQHSKCVLAPNRLVHKPTAWFKNQFLSKQEVTVELWPTVSVLVRTSRSCRCLIDFFFKDL